MKWHACTDMTEVTGAHFDPSHGYQPIDWDDVEEEGRECRCTLDLMDEEGFALTEPYYILPVTNVEVRGNRVTDPEAEEVSGRPVDLALRTSWNTDEHYRSETEVDDDSHWRNTRSDTDPKTPTRRHRPEPRLERRRRHRHLGHQHRRGDQFRHRRCRAHRALPGLAVVARSQRRIGGGLRRQLR